MNNTVNHIKTVETLFTDRGTKMSKGQCGKCGSIVESTHRHDFVWCECKESFLDGGDDYFRAGGYMTPVFEEPLKTFNETSEK